MMLNGFQQGLPELATSRLSHQQPLQHDFLEHGMSDDTSFDTGGPTCEERDIALIMRMR
jgi:hypothetical protein